MEASLKSWFVIINPTSGNGTSIKKWPKIKGLLHSYKFHFEYAITDYPKHSSELVHQAIEKNIMNIICIGGDGTIHNIVNGIMTQNRVPSNQVHVGVIPIGTGNDWVKTYGISKRVEEAIQAIRKGQLSRQDIGRINFYNSKKAPVYFNNLAGMGFDGYVVSKVQRFKHLGSLAYIFGAITSLFSFKNFESELNFKSKKITGKNLMILIGLCRYSGGGMQLTKDSNPSDGLFDVSIAKDLSKLEIIQNLNKLFNGKIVDHKKVDTLKTDSLSIELNPKNLPYIQADGELIGKGPISISLIPGAFSFYH